jgi:3D (Asp-Asp-Asp) domain-containing protein
MAICNRDLDQSQQLYVEKFMLGTVGVGATVAVAYIASPSVLQKIAITGLGISGTPVYTPNVMRWTSAGVTVFPVGSAVTLTGTYGLSGAGVSATFNSGSSLSQLQANDLLILVSSGANTNALQLIGDVVLQATQDIKTTFGV